MDHRIVMMAAIAGLIAKGETNIHGAKWADISYPGFFDTLKELGR
jgi:3-phosphoshikimate 1-carboxyvinyltransferase